MKFTVIRSKFLEGLKSVQNIVAGKGTMPILQNVKIEANGKELRLTTTDLDISIMSVCPCEVIEQGETTLPVKLLASSIANVAEGPVEISVDAQDRATLVAGSAKFKIAGLPVASFPKLPEDDDAFVYRISQATLKEMLRKVSYAASQDDTRRTLKGVLMSFKDMKLTMVATDGRRLALIEQEVEFPKTSEKDIVLPSKAVQELQRSLNGEEEVVLSVQKSQLRFEIGELVIYTKMIDETYPNYRQVIPNGTTETIEIDRQMMIDALQRASVMTMDEAHSTKLIFDGGKLTVTSAASDIGEAKDDVPIKYAGERIEIMFNPAYVLDPLKAIDDDVITMNLNDGHSPAVIKCSVPFLYVLMPLRIS